METKVKTLRPFLDTGSTDYTVFPAAPADQNQNQYFSRPTDKYITSGKCDPPYIKNQIKREVLLFVASLPARLRRYDRHEDQNI
jgi:hypothetical protein